MTVLAVAIVTVKWSSRSWGERRISSSSLNKENLGPLLNGVCDLMTVNTYTADIVPSLPPFSPRSPRPLSFVKAFKEENCQQWIRTNSRLLARTWPIEVHGTQQTASKGTERAGWCLCKATLYHLWKVLEIREGPQWLEKGNVAPIFKKGQKNPGVLVGSKLNKSQHCTLAVKKAGSILGWMSRTTASRSREVIIDTLSFNKDIDILEQVQWRATKMVKGL